MVSNQAYTAVIFDFEGTLVDFQWQLARAEGELRRALAALGFEGGDFARGNYATLWNAAADVLMPQGRIAELGRALCPIYDRWDLDALTRWAPRFGAVELVRGLAARGLRVGIVSNIGRRALAEGLDRFELAPWVSSVVTRDEVTFMKPRGEGILRVLADWQVAPSDALVVGDSLADVYGARAAGVSVAIIRDGECDEAAFAEAPPDYMISRLDELVDLVAGR